MSEPVKSQPQISKYIVVGVLVYALLASFALMYYKYVDSDVRTPFIGDIFAGSCDLQIEDLRFSVNTTSNRFLNVTVDIKNYDTLYSHAGVFYIVFYNKQNAEIAYGTMNTGAISPGVRIGSLSLKLIWAGIYTLKDFDYGRVTLTQTE